MSLAKRPGFIVISRVRYRRKNILDLVADEESSKDRRMKDSLEYAIEGQARYHGEIVGEN